MKARELTFDEKKSAEAAFQGHPFDPRWSESSRAVYEGILTALQGVPLVQESATEPFGSHSRSNVAVLAQPAESAPDVPSHAEGGV